VVGLGWGLMGGIKGVPVKTDFHEIPLTFMKIFMKFHETS
jgi:hypothetical protein